MLEIIKVIIYGIIEGITEWLPISSTGHLILLDKWIPLNVSPEFFEMFKVVIQLGAILAVIVLYFHKLNPFTPSKTSQQKKETISIWLKVFIATLPALFVFPFDNLIEQYTMNYLTVSIMLVLYGIFFIWIEKYYRKESVVNSLETLSYKTALFIGLIQILAIIPGTSRSGATILGAILLGTSRYVATEFSFFLGIPAMFGLSSLKIMKFMMSSTISLDEVFILVVGMLVAFVVSMIVIQKLLDYIKKHDFTIFGIYRIVLGVVILLVSFFIK